MTETWHLCSPEEIADVRQGVEKYLSGQGCSAVAIDAVVLIVNELASNAITHGRPDIKVTVKIIAGCVCGIVTDHGPGMPHPKRPRNTTQSGRGLMLVDSLAAEWHVVRLAGQDGKQVHFTYCEATS